MRKLLLSIGLITLFACNNAPAQGNVQSGESKINTCNGCHGIPGYKNAYPNYKVPRLAGQNPAYLIAALKAYESGERSHPTMQAQAQSLSQQDIEDIVAKIDSLELSGGTPEKVQDTTAPAKIQLCQSCHGADGMGIAENYPVLAGQYASYIARALMDYRNGDRNNAIMGGFAATLTDQDIEELAEWYSNMAGLRDLSKGH
ncbi:MAG: cytochrome c553 [Lysobacterales bacterium]|jgi:cytochrome c553